MNLDELIEEGRRLARPCVFLRATGTGTPAAHWYPKTPARRQEGFASGELLWLTVDLTQVPGVTLASDAPRYLTVYTDEKDFETGRVEFADEWPTPPLTDAQALPLFASFAEPLPPIDAVFTQGANAVRQWMNENGWTPDEPNGWDFRNPIIDAYNRAYQTGFPLFHDSDVYAMLGGWHTPWPEGDWHDLLDKTLVVWTFADSEPWVEVWQDAGGDFTVIQRIT